MSPNAPAVQDKVIGERFRCDGCGANVVFDADSDGLLCSFCRKTRQAGADGNVAELDLEDFLVRGTQHLQPMAVQALQASCDACGAVVNFTPPETATVCAFCGNNIVAQPKAADPLIAPNGVLPFSVAKEQAAANFNAWLGSLWFAPNDLQQLIARDKIVSIYIPYWTFDAFALTEYQGQRGDNYTDWETVTRNGKSERRSVVKIRWSHASGRVSRNFDDLCVPATESLPRNYLDELEPWDLGAVRPFEPAYLSGHSAQAYQVPLANGFAIFKREAECVIERDCRYDIGGDHQRVDSMNTAYSQTSFKHLLLPVYAGAYRFKNKTYQIVINGRSGEVQGGRPYSWIKITLFVMAILFVLAVVFLALRG